MTTDMPSGQVSDLDWLLSGLVQRVPYTRSAVLLSADGLVKSLHGMDADSADHMAALAAGLYSLGRSAGARFGDSGEVRQVVVELDSTLLFVSTMRLRHLPRGPRRTRGGRGGARLRDDHAGEERPALSDDARETSGRGPRRHGAVRVSVPQDGPLLDDAATASSARTP